MLDASIEQGFPWYVIPKDNFSDIKKVLDKFRTPIKSDKPEVYNYIRGVLMGGHKLKKKLKVSTKKVVEELSKGRTYPLNHSQMESVWNAIDNPIALIQGPPGTGKTTTAAVIVQYLIDKLQQLEMNKAPKKRGMKRILVTADSNKAVDRITESLIEAGILVARIPSVSSIPNPFFDTSKIV